MPEGAVGSGREHLRGVRLQDHDQLVAGGHRLEVERLPGRAPTLVFLHEGLGSASSWRDFPRSVAEATGCAALVYSRWGYGKSDPVTRPRPLSFMHDEALVALPELLEKEGIEDAILVGHSDGASIALVYAGEIGEKIRGVVAIAPHVFVEEVCVTAIRAVRDAFPGSELERRLARHHADVEGAFHGWADAWLDPEFRRWDLTGYLPGVRVPVLVIQGDRDEYGTLAQVDAVCAKVSGPAERVIVRGAGHILHRERPEETAAAVVSFVRGLITG